jgi:hypothetical protein
MAVQDNAVMCDYDIDQGLEVGLVRRDRAVRVMELEELPSRVGGGEGCFQEVDLRLGRAMAGDGVGVVVDGCGLGRG